ncbi:GNAT family N-acetyltransferase [Cohnella sp. GCM10027633]|uniref:GNAT family N-acetyltransferase n=1 Tax=unclassified Cohnella TaxID=2636738 RepID=UPI00363B88E9
MEEIRLVRPEEFSEAIRLADHVFRKGRRPSVQHSYPHSFSSALSQSYGVFEDGELVTFMGLVPTTVNVHSATLSAFKIGQVCTAEQARGKGFAGQILEKALSHANLSNASLIFVSGDRPLYERAGCYRYGQIAYAELDGQWAKKRGTAESRSCTVREMSPYDWLEMHRLSAKRTVSFEYSVWDIANLVEAASLASTSKRIHRVLIAEREGKMTGWLVCAVALSNETKGTSEAIEWSGSAETVVQLLAEAIHRYAIDRCVIGVSWFEEELLQELEVPYSVKAAIPGTIHVVDPGRLLNQLRPYWEREHGPVPSDLHAYYDNERNVVMKSEGREYRMTGQSFVRLLFSPEQPASIDSPIDPGDWMRRCLPVPLPNPNGLGFV